MNKIDQLATLQKQYMDEAMFADNRTKLHATWFDDTTTDYWRHQRMYATLAPFAAQYRTATWLTVGDGRYGLEAIRLKKIFNLALYFQPILLRTCCASAKRADISVRTVLKMQSS